MEYYHKINTLFKRVLEKGHPNHGHMILGEWTTPELAYLADNQWQFTEKVDGTNIWINWSDGVVTFGGRTAASVIPPPLLAYLEETFTVDRFLDAELSDLTIYGEGYGPNINGGGKYRQDPAFVAFDIKCGGFWLLRNNVDDIARKLGIESVPVIGSGTLYTGINIVKSGLKSTWGDFKAEGLVASPVVPMFDRAGRRIITKIKEVDFR